MKTVKSEKIRSTSEKSYIVGQTSFVLPVQYSELKPVGNGSYGVVVSAVDSQLRRKVAIKKITPMAKHKSDAKHVLREMRLMRYLGKHPKIVSLNEN